MQHKMFTTLAISLKIATMTPIWKWHQSFALNGTDMIVIWFIHREKITLQNRVLVLRKSNCKSGRSTFGGHNTTQNHYYDPNLEMLS
jgi:hypothetical protein